MAQYKGFISFAALVALLGCGDDGEGGGKESDGNSVESACAATCDGMREAKCRSFDLSGCEAACEQEAARVPFTCRMLADQLLDCASKATFSCGSEGPVATFCAPLEAQLDVCTGSTPIPGPTPDAGIPSPSASDAATDSNVVGNDAGLGLPDASTPGTDASAMAPLVDAGRDASAPRPDAGGSTGDVLSCELDVDDEPCDRCMKRSCCTSLQACGPACQVIAACIAECETDSCIDGCAARYPAGAAAFNALLQCTSGSCATECSDEPMMPARPTMRPPPADKCLPITVPSGTCTNPNRPHGYDCASQPFSDCVLVPNIANVYCCG